MKFSLVLIFLASVGSCFAFEFLQPPPSRGEGLGPYPQLILAAASLIDGNGGGPIGPVDIHIAGNRIRSISPSPAGGTSDTGVRVLDLSGKYVLPGFIDSHAHIGYGLVPTEYVFKLWLAHGITTVREVSNEGLLQDLLGLKAESAANVIVAPRLFLYPIVLSSPPAALMSRGADGLKTYAMDKAHTVDLLEYARAHGIRVACHDAGPYDAMALAGMGLSSLEHLFGLPEAVGGFTTSYSQDYLSRRRVEQFRTWASLWQRAVTSPQNDVSRVAAELVHNGITLVPTLSVYSALADVSSARNAEWQAEYCLSALWKSFEPDPGSNFGFWYDWTTADEIAWKRNLRLWMDFLNTFHLAGGRIAAGSDSGFMYDLYGFGYIHELEMLQEAGLSPTQVLSCATAAGAALLGQEKQIGTVEPGKLADLVICGANPLTDFKLLYATGAIKLNRDGQPTKVEAIEYVMKDGILYDAQQLRAEVRAMASDQRRVLH